MIFATSILLLGCVSEPPNPASDVSRLELRAGDLDVAIDAHGAGRFSSGRRAQAGSFDIGETRFKALVQSLSEFQREAAPTEQVARAFLSSTCPRGVSEITDAGTISVRWIGPGTDRLFATDLGCDAERNSARNRRLRGLISSLPLPD